MARNYNVNKTTFFYQLNVMVFQYLHGSIPICKSYLKQSATFRCWGMIQNTDINGLSQLTSFQSLLTQHMMTSSNWYFFRVTGHLCGEFTGPRWIPHTRPVTRSFDVFFDLRLNKRLSKQSWGWWLETPSRTLWRHCNVLSFQLFVVSFLPCKYQAYSSHIPGPERNKGFDCLKRH